MGGGGWLTYIVMEVWFGVVVVVGCFFCILLSGNNAKDRQTDRHQTDRMTVLDMDLNEFKGGGDPVFMKGPK